MILIGLGSNLSTQAGPPSDTVLAAVEELRKRGIDVAKLSPFYASAPLGPADQPWYVNAVAELESDLAGPEACLDRLHAIERIFGRRRAERWQARGLDLDLLDWHGAVRPNASSWRRAAEASAAPQSLVLPHPGLHRRRFVLQPLLDIAPAWRHPVLKRSAVDMIARIKGQEIERI